MNKSSNSFNWIHRLHTKILTQIFFKSVLGLVTLVSLFAFTAFAAAAAGVSQHLLLPVNGSALQDVVLERLDSLNAVVNDPEKKTVGS